MLVLTREAKEGIVIDKNIKVTIISIIGNRVRIGISAPKEVNIRRGELNVEGDDDESDSLPN